MQDLLRHTSGLTYEFRGNGPIHKMYMAARIYSRDQTNAEQVAALGKIPLLHQPGSRWEYSRSTDVLGRLIEVLSGTTLGAYLEHRIFAPLGMIDTAFHVPHAQHARLAEAFAQDPESGGTVQLVKVKDPPKFESGGGGLVSTANDYAHFLQMLLNRGTFGGARFLSRKTIELMTADHLGPITGAPDLLLPGYGFGLGFAIRLQPGISHVPGSVGQYFWGGLAGTTFWVDPAEAVVRDHAHSGAGAARLLPHAVSRSGLRGVRRLNRRCVQGHGGLRAPPGRRQQAVMMARRRPRGVRQGMERNGSHCSGNTSRGPQ